MKISLSKNFPSRRRLPGRAIFFSTLFILILTAVFPNAAFAQAATLSDVMCNVFINLGPLAPLLSAIAFIAGAILIGAGLLALKDHSDSPQNNPLHKGIARIGFGAALMTLPFIAGNLINSLFLAPAAGGAVVCAGDIPSEVGPGVGLDVLVENFVGNITLPFISLISVVAYVMGILFIIRGLLRGAKYGSDPRASSTHHILAYLIIGAMLIVAGSTAGDAIATLFGLGSSSDAVDYNTNQSRVMGWNSVAAFGAAATNFSYVIAACLTFFQLIGILAFVRGLYIVKNAVEGSGQATMAQGFTHIVGGVLAINIYSILEVIDQTFGTDLLV